MLICQQLEMAVNPSLTVTLVQNGVAARVAKNDLILAWREAGERLLCPRSLVGLTVPHLLKQSRAKQWRKPAKVTKVKPLLGPPGAAEWLAPALGRLRPMLNALKAAQRPWFGEVSHQAVKGGYKDAESAIKNFYSGKAKAPKLRGKSRRLAFRADNGVDTVRIEGKYIYLPEKAGGVVKLKEGLRWPGKVIRECRIREKAGRWFACVRVQVTPEEYGQRRGVGTGGLDLGLKTFVCIACPGDTEATVEKIMGPEPLRRSLTGLRRKQRVVSRRKKGSKNQLKAQRAVAEQHRRIECIQKDFLQQLSHRLTAELETIQVETLSIKGWQKLWGRKASDLAPAELLRQLGYKTGWRGGQLVKVDWDFPSSQLCHDCGFRVGKLDLSIREWECPGCGVVHDRDANAALNIRDFQPGAIG